MIEEQVDSIHTLHSANKTPPVIIFPKKVSVCFGLTIYRLKSYLIDDRRFAKIEDVSLFLTATQCTFFFLLLDLLKKRLRSNNVYLDDDHHDAGCKFSPDKLDLCNYFSFSLSTDFLIISRAKISVGHLGTVY